MRFVLAAFLLLAGSASAQADPYKWCAHYSGEGGNGSNCYFLTLEQCRWTISGAGGRCAPNPFYTGGPDERAARRAKR